jgi:hypothetical protein
MATAPHSKSSVPPDVAISFPSDFDTCPKCGELRFFVRAAEGLRSVCGCTADPSGPAAASARPDSPQSPLVEVFAVAA